MLHGERGTWTRLCSPHEQTLVDWQDWLRREGITRGVLAKLNTVSITLNPSRVVGYLCCQVVFVANGLRMYKYDVVHI